MNGVDQSVKWLIKQSINNSLSLSLFLSPNPSQPTPPLWQDYKAGLAITEVELTAAHVKGVDRRGFEISTPFKNFWCVDLHLCCFVCMFMCVRPFSCSHKFGSWPSFPTPAYGKAIIKARQRETIKDSEGQLQQSLLKQSDVYNNVL